MTGLPTAAIIIDKRRQKKGGVYPIKLRITFQGKQEYFKTRKDLTEADYKKAMSANPKGTKFKELKKHFQKMEVKANAILDRLDPFTFDEFKAAFHNVDKRRKNTDVFDAYRDYIESLEENDQVGSASSYKESMSALKRFHKKDTLSFRVVTVDWLKRFERWMIKGERSPSTVGIYLRPLRALFNLAKERGHISAEHYPFGKRRYTIPASRNIKKALEAADLKRIFEYEPKTDVRRRARDIWMFSYLCNGMNMKDICLLKWTDIKGETVEYIRAKTARTTKGNQKPIRAALHPRMKSIIDEWGNPDSVYIFGAIAPGMAAARIRENVRNFTRVINRHMATICNNLGLPKVTTYAARHSFSTILKRSGVSIEYISESLGHKDLRTTENYLDSFEEDVRKDISGKLMDL